jgi:hypothetical protein
MDMDGFFDGLLIGVDKLCGFSVSYPQPQCYINVTVTIICEMFVIERIDLAWFSNARYVKIP